MNLFDEIAKLGHLASRRQLGSIGVGRFLIDRALETERLHRVRPGWVATVDAGRPEVMAVLAGGRLTGASALQSYGIWAGDDRRIHVQVAPNAHRVAQQPTTPLTLFREPRIATTSVSTHWVHAALSPPSMPSWRVGVADALLQFAAREQPEQVAAAIESAVTTRCLARSQLPQLFNRMPKRVSAIESRLTYAAGSGLETVCRFRLENEGFDVRQQVLIGSDRVDFMLGGWLVIEVDGDKWHNPVTDRQRTNRLMRAGYVVLRFGYADVFDRWDETLATIRVVLSARTLGA